MFRDIEEKMDHDASERTTTELMEKMTKLVTLEIDELHVLLESTRKDANKATHQVKLLNMQLLAAQQLVRNWEHKGQSEIAKTARRLFATLASTQTRAAKAEREILTLKEQVGRLRSQRDEARADIIKVCAVWSVLLAALGKFLAHESNGVVHLFHR
ncbi:unnamed protein product [Agarophyton chilense]